MEIEVTDALVSWCDRKGLTRKATVGAVTKHGNKRAGAPLGSDPQVSAEGGTSGGIRLIVSNTILRQSAAKAPSLKIVSNR